MTGAPLQVRLAAPGDLDAVCAIVNHYIATTAWNFRTEPQQVTEWHAEWNAHRERYPWLVAARGADVVGVAYAAPWKPRGAYGWCCEVTGYVAPGATGQGVGGALYGRLLDLLDQQGYRSQVAVIALPNPASVALHEAVGFRPAGVLHAVGYKHGAWRDVGFWQRTRAGADAPAIRPVAAVASSLRAGSG